MDNSTLISCSKDRTIRVWDLSNAFTIDPDESKFEFYIKQYEDEIRAIQKEKIFWKQECFRWQEKYKKLEDQYAQLKNSIEKIPPIIKSEDISFYVLKLPEFSSSLFHSVAYALEPSLQEMILENKEWSEKIDLSIRKLMSHEILKSETYFSKLKEYPLLKYIQKIEDPDFRGSEEELEILGNIYKTEFCVYDIQSSEKDAILIPKMNRFPRRMYLCWYSKYERYDIVTLRIKEKEKEKEISIFNSKDNGMYFQILNLWENMRNLNLKGS